MSFYERIFFSDYLEPDEKLHHVVHRHWSVMTRRMIHIAFFGLLIPIGMVLFFFDPYSTVAYGLYAWAGIGLMASLYVFTDWYSDAWLVTNKSIIDVRWDGFFKKSAQRLNYEGIESVSYDVQGIVPTLLNYGVLKITKESGLAMELTHISKPRKAEARISEMRVTTEKTTGKNNIEVLKQLLSEVIEERLKK